MYTLETIKPLKRTSTSKENPVFEGLTQFFELYPLYWLFLLVGLVALVFVVLIGVEIMRKRPELAVLFGAVVLVIVGVEWQVLNLLEHTYDNLTSYTNMDDYSFNVPFMVAGALLVVALIVRFARRKQIRHRQMFKEIYGTPAPF